MKRLLAIAGSPDLYSEFARTSALPNLLALLSHENTDIAGDVLDLLKELTEEDVVEDSVSACSPCRAVSAGPLVRCMTRPCTKLRLLPTHLAVPCGFRVSWERQQRS